MVIHFLKEPGALYRQKKLMFVILLLAVFGAKKLFKKGWGQSLSWLDVKVARSERRSS